MSILKRLFSRNSEPRQRVRICVECGMPIAEHKDWCSILRTQRERDARAPLAAQARSGWARSACGALASRSRCVRRMLHQSLCSATGIPHSTQMRTRATGCLRKNLSRKPMRKLYAEIGGFVRGVNPRC